MVRPDKIAYMITCFKPNSLVLEQYDYSDPADSSSLTEISLNMIKRIGVVSKIHQDEDVSFEFCSNIPYGREEFLIRNINEHSDSVCTDSDPSCEHCVINEHCDYYNKKNEWMVR